MNPRKVKSIIEEAPAQVEGDRYSAILTGQEETVITRWIRDVYPECTRNRPLILLINALRFGFKGAAVDLIAPLWRALNLEGKYRHEVWTRAVEKNSMILSD